MVYDIVEDISIMIYVGVWEWLWAWLMSYFEDLQENIVISISAP